MTVDPARSRPSERKPLPTTYRCLRGVAAVFVATVVGALGTIVPAHAVTTASVPPGLRRATIDDIRARASGDASTAGVFWYYLRNVQTQQYLTVRGAQAANGIPIIQSPWLVEGTRQEQAWRFDVNSAGFWTIRSGNTNDQKAITIKDKSTANGGAVVQRAYAGQDNQEFILHDYNDTTFDFENVHSLRCLAIPGGRPAAGLAVIQWDCPDSQHPRMEQRWELYYWP